MLVCACRFIPQMTKSALQQALSSAGILPPGDAQLQRRLQPMKCKLEYDGNEPFVSLSWCLVHVQIQCLNSYSEVIILIP